ncbi:MAG: signal recognition particle-docking protein FtsY, partial [Mesorhizobium sp.]
MAGFFKKIFSFGKKEVVEERVDETAPLPPIKWDALEALKPETEQEPTFRSADAGANHPRAALGTSPIEGEAGPAPQPVPEEPKPEPAPDIPPAPEPVIPPAPEPVVPSEPEPLPQP